MSSIDEIRPTEPTRLVVPRDNKVIDGRIFVTAETSYQIVGSSSAEFAPAPGCRFAPIVLTAVSLLSVFGCSRKADIGDEMRPLLRQQCVELMQQTLQNESRWVKVHAAEFLISLDYRDGVHDAFTAESARLGDEPQYRIGIWRVLASLERHNRSAYAARLGQIREVFLDDAAPDRIHAVETLAKLGYQFSEPLSGSELREDLMMEVSPFTNFARQGPAAGRAYALWVLLNNHDPHAEGDLASALAADDEMTQLTAAYALRHQDAISARTFDALRSAVTKASSDSKARVYLLTATFKHWPVQEISAQQEQLQTELLAMLDQGAPGEQYEVSRLFAEMGDEFSESLIKVLNRDDVSVDVKSSIAHALCRIGRRRTARMSLADWLVVGLYGVGMLAVGVYFSRRTKTAGDYLLGGGNMKPWAVGLSLFATLLSTLSYLAWPGEMIKNGPIILMGYAAYPFVYFAVGWFLIPTFMRLRVTSAYEILEQRLGLSIRLLGSTLFLSLRFLWMASIVYWTTSIVLLPASGLDKSYAGHFAILLGLVTVIYTSLGGLRAVVVTDVIQTFILFAGAITSLILITIALGGVSAWFPSQWASHWTEPRIWFDFDPAARSTLANAMLGTFAWYVCTAGSDQMAIQRYLATRDVKAARHTLAVSLTANVVVLVFLGLMGLALMSFFSAHPDRMADGQTVYANADKLFPRFVVVGLPMGMSGLVIAGLLAAAMSSLSSGVNSSAAVISEDFVRRLGKTAQSESGHMGLVRWASVGVGILVVLLSSLIGNVEGNMLEVVYKVVNLFTAPLFFLFFMAIFVPWANAGGTWIGSVAGITAAVLIAFWKDLFGVPGISFLWIMPGSLAVSVVVGTSASFLLGGRRTSVIEGSS